MPPPAWAPNAYFQLSFTQLHVPKDPSVLATRTPQRPPPPPGAVDLTANNAMLLQPGNEERMREIIVSGLPWVRRACPLGLSGPTDAAATECSNSIRPGGRAIAVELRPRHKRLCREPACTYLCARARAHTHAHTP